MAIKDKRIQLLRALMTFGGPKDAPRNAEISAMPDSILETGVGVQSTPSDESDDSENSDNQDQPDSEDLRNKRALRMKLLKRSLNYGSNSR